jgi:hypothetical protein
MTSAEDRLSDKLDFGRSLTSKEQREGRYMPDLWEVCHDLENYIKEGSLIEIPVNCTLTEIFEAEPFRGKRGRPPNRILRDSYYDEILKIQFRTIPGGTLYELIFSKDERTAHSGYFKKIQ